MNLDLISTNVYSRHLSNRLLVCGTCVLYEWPEIVEKLREDRTVLTVCPELVQMNIIIAKIASVLAKSEVKEIAILTKDGSPHCIGLHFSTEWALNLTKSDGVAARYFVIEHGNLYEIGAEKIKEKRHLSR